MARNPIGYMRQKAILGSYQDPGNLSSVFNPPQRELGGWRSAIQAGDFDTPEPEIDMSVPQIRKTPQRSEGSQYYDEIENIRNTAGPGITAYKNALNEMPQMQDFQPNWMTRIASGLGGLSAGIRSGAGEGINVAQGLNSSNYRQAMGEYQNKLGTLQEQADMERDDMKTRMEGLMKAKELGLRYDEYLAKRDETAQTNAARQTTAEAAMIRARAAQDAAAKNDYTTPVAVRGGFMITNKNDPSDIRIIQAPTIQDAQLEISRGNLGVAQRNATVNEKQLPIQQQNANTASQNMMINQRQEEQEQGLRPRRVESQEKSAGLIRGADQQAIRELADMELKDDPEYGKFYRMRPGKVWGETDQQVDQTDFSREDWADYQAALAAKVQEIQERRR